MKNTKLHLRKHFRQLRSQVAEKYRHDAAQRAVEILIKQPLFLQSKHIGCYLPAKDEFDTSFIISTIWEEKKHCYLPILKGSDSKALRFVAYNEGDALRLNQYSIFEPVNLNREIMPQQLDFVIAPLVAFDLHGARLGMGGGYYDHTFVFLQRETNRKPKLIGLAYAAQQAEMLPSDPWDISLDAVLTEKGFISFSR